MPGAARPGNVNDQGVRGELNPPPRRSQGRMLACYTTNTIAIGPARLSDQGGSRTLTPRWARPSEDRVSTCSTTWPCQWTVEGVERSSAGCKPAVFPLDDTPRIDAVAPVGIEPTAPCLRDRCSAD